VKWLLIASRVKHQESTQMPALCMPETSCNQAVSWSSLLKIPSNHLYKDKCSLHVHSYLSKLCLYAQLYLQAWFEASRRLLSGANFLYGACWASQTRHQLCVSAHVSACTAWACCWKTTAAEGPPPLSCRAVTPICWLWGPT